MTSALPDRPPSTPPDWLHCGRGASAQDPVGCRGIQVPGNRACLAHLSQRQRRRYGAGLVPGADIDHRGTVFTGPLLHRLLNALRAPDTGRPEIGNARFDEATFADPVMFNGAAFAGDAWFTGVTFKSDAWFDKVTFADGALFSSTVFERQAVLRWVTFTGFAAFDNVTFTNGASFGWATFTRGVIFQGMTSAGDLQFDAAQFETAERLGPLVCGSTVDLDGAVFGSPVTVEIAARKLLLRRTQWVSTAALRLRHAEVDLAGALLEHPMTLVAEPAPFTNWRGDCLEGLLAGWDPGVRVRDVAGVDLAHLSLTDTDLSGCRFAGAVHLDQLRLEGRTIFASPPKGWSRRRTLAEEHYWRAATAGRPALGQRPSKREWEPGSNHPDLERTSGPETLAAVYRQLRKALEDAKNEPGADDFYYGECEMRRHDNSPGTTWSERVLLTVYWAVSGYGLRATRALVWLAVTMTITIFVMMLWGIPIDSPKPTTTGRQVRAGRTITLVTDTPDPANPTGPLVGRLTTDRFEKALRTVINSVVFRSSGQELTTAGTYTEMTSRLTEPLLLGLAILAIRNRVKR
ncbi:pentapeptide repeat-containing protein [Streptomyces galbus]|uniref:Pentapeptide repeat-containing protein n=1 Tax=Streptomyces galbus TaxID=33898 RepID=A0A4U5W3N8_STRGB|nr:pentapeptide repeat-containing protein [Streptomyces galbus]TKS96033.1 pentapeptide repeat-containing protein [Streptomyces galbus]